MICNRVFRVNVITDEQIVQNKQHNNVFFVNVNLDFLSSGTIGQHREELY